MNISKKKKKKNSRPVKRLENRVKVRKNGKKKLGAFSLFKAT